jgi:protein-arginine kinase activator protein McsA
MKLHPIIQESRLPQETKEIIQEILEDDFDNDWNLLLESMMEHAVGDEEYELAAEIRDYLIKYK